MAEQPGKRGRERRVKEEKDREWLIPTDAVRWF